MKKPLNIKKFLLPNIPYVFIALFATKLKLDGLTASPKPTFFVI